MNTHSVGEHFEDVAVSFLLAKGYRILQRNFRCRQGEIDIVAEDEGTIVFAEVKYRAGNTAGSPEEAVTARKKRVISRTADYFRIRFRIHENIPCRFDVIAVAGDEIRHYENAFDYVPV